MAACQGTTKLKQAFGPREAGDHLLRIGAFVRAKCRELAEKGRTLEQLDLTGTIHLRGGKGGLAADYEQAGAVVATAEAAAGAMVF